MGWHLSHIGMMRELSVTETEYDRAYVSIPPLMTHVWILNVVPACRQIHMEFGLCFRRTTDALSPLRTAADICRASTDKPQNPCRLHNRSLARLIWGPGNLRYPMIVIWRLEMDILR